MKEKPINYAFIDSQNLHLGTSALGWKLDMQRFRVYLKEKYNIHNAYLFIGYLPENAEMYAMFQEWGYICIFKPTLKYKDGTTKGNCDAELVLHAMIQYDKYDKAVIVTGDGDFQCLAKHLQENDKLKVIIIPNQRKYSALLKFDIFKPYLRFVNDLQKKLQYIPKKKNPRKDGTLKGKSSIGDKLNISRNGKNVNKQKR